jgi:hypothetical protein
MTYRPRVYGASKLSTWRLWLTLREDSDWAFVDWTASWPLKVDQEESAGPQEFGIAWETDLREIRSSDFVMLVYDEGIKGALVEAGMAMGIGTRVITVGLPAEHTWSYHPLVTRCYDLVSARNMLFKYTILIPKKKVPTNE